MTDVACEVCAAWITPFGQTEGVFCPRQDCPGLASGLVLDTIDVTNCCNPTPFVLNFAGEKITPAKGAAPPPVAEPVPVKKGKRRPLPTTPTPSLFD